MNCYYIGTKIIKAKPLNRTAYNKYRGWELPGDENGADEGYLVEYSDGGQANHPDHAGYVSWSPKEQFDKAYVIMGDVSALLPHQQRVAGEHVELNSKISSLSGFIGSPIWKAMDADDQVLMQEQLECMRHYSAIIARRLTKY